MLTPTASQQAVSRREGVAMKWRAHSMVHMRGTRAPRAKCPERPSARVRKPTSNLALWATTTRPARSRASRSATSSRRGAPSRSAATNPWSSLSGKS